MIILKKIIIRLFSLALIFILFSCDSPTLPDGTYKLIQNPGFENLQSSRLPAGWSGLSSSWSADPNIVHGGLYSLRLQNEDPSRYLSIYQEIFVVPGKSYRLGLWAKTKGVLPESAGVSFCIEYQAPNGTWLGGEYETPSLQGTSDWQNLRLHEIIIPTSWMGKPVGHASLALFLTRGATGTAWFDDICLEEIKPPLLEAFLLKPNYRGIIVEGEQPVIKIRARINPESTEIPLVNPELMIRLEDPNGALIKEVREDCGARINNQQIESVLDFSDNLPPQGEYLLRLRLKEKDKSDWLTENIEPVSLISLAKRNSFPVFVDEKNRLLSYGQPFFPIGIYTANTEHHRPTEDNPRDDLKEELKTLADSPFNILVNYSTLVPLTWVNEVVKKEACYDFIRQYLDLLSEYNLRILCFIDSRRFFGLPDPFPEMQEIINGLKGHPALLGWYLNDEIGASYRPQLMAYNDTFRSFDPNHPTWSVLYQLQYLSPLAQATDILGTDPYPIPHTPIVYVAEAAKAAYEAGQRARPFWLVVQTCASPPPTRDEVRCMTFLGLIHKASGIFYYSYFDLWKQNDNWVRWEWLKKIGEEVRLVSSVLLYGEDVPEGEIRCDQPEVHFYLKRYQNKFYLLVANSSQTKRVRAVFQGSAQTPFSQPITDFLTDEVPSSPLVINNNQLITLLLPLEVRVYTWP